MVVFQQDAISNRLLSLLTSEDFSRLADGLTTVQLPLGFAFSETGKLPEYCYFVQSGIGSIVAISPEGRRAEVGLFGRDGMTPTLGAIDSGSSPFHVFMQVPGYGLRISTDKLLAAMTASVNMQKLFSLYGQTLANQTAFTALSNAVHPIDQRLARWILMCHDRTDGNTTELTHEFLAILLAVRRPSISTALHVLEGQQFIVSERGQITVRDREALEAFAVDAYGPPEREYKRLIGSLR